MPQSQEMSVCNSYNERLVPGSILEFSSNVRPDMYTNRGARNLLQSYSHEIAVSKYVKIYRFGFSFQQSSGKWTRLSLHISASIESGYFGFRRSKTYGLNYSQTVSFPASLIPMLERSLAHAERLEQDSAFTAFLGKGSEGDEERSHQAMLPIKMIEPASDVSEYMREITRKINHWGCPRYFDRALVQRGMTSYSPTNTFMVFLENRWVLASRFGSDRIHIDRDLYILKILYHLRMKPGVTPFLGVMIDEVTDGVTGYLCEFPATGLLTNIMVDATSSGSPIPWQRREKWCRQIVQVVAEIYSTDFVVGYLGETMDTGVGIDAEDNAVLYGKFATTLRIHENPIGFLPPECRKSAASTGEVSASFESDLYQLGMLLWRIGASVNNMPRVELCERAGCTTRVGKNCPEQNQPSYPQLAASFLSTLRISLSPVVTSSLTADFPQPSF